MILGKDYATMTVDQLVDEEKKLKSQKMPTTLFMGVFVGIAVWSATHEGGAYTFILLALVSFIGSRYLKSLKGVQEEISRRNTSQ